MARGKSATTSAGGNGQAQQTAQTRQRAPKQLAKQEQNPAAGLGALSKREQQNLGRWIGGTALLLQKAGIEVPMSQPA